MRTLTALLCAIVLALTGGAIFYWLPGAARTNAKEQIASQSKSTESSECTAAIVAAHPDLDDAPGIGDRVDNISRLHYLAGTIRSFECPVDGQSSFRAIPTPLSSNGSPGWVMNTDGSATLIRAEGAMTISPNHTLIINTSPR